MRSYNGIFAAVIFFLLFFFLPAGFSILIFSPPPSFSFFFRSPVGSCWFSIPRFNRWKIVRFYRLQIFLRDLCNFSYLNIFLFGSAINVLRLSSVCLYANPQENSRNNNNNNKIIIIITGRSLLLLLLFYLFVNYSKFIFDHFPVSRRVRKGKRKKEKTGTRNECFSFFSIIFLEFSRVCTIMFYFIKWRSLNTVMILNPETINNLFYFPVSLSFFFSLKLYLSSSAFSPFPFSFFLSFGIFIFYFLFFEVEI